MLLKAKQSPVRFKDSFVSHFKMTFSGSETVLTLPILMIHGWPGSFYEFYKTIPYLINPDKYGGRENLAFEVICPSIPGYGFSDPPEKKGKIEHIHVGAPCKSCCLQCKILQFLMRVMLSCKILNPHPYTDLYIMLLF